MLKTSWIHMQAYVQGKGKSFMFISICDIRDKLLTLVKLLKELCLIVLWRQETQQFLIFKNNHGPDSLYVEWKLPTL